MNNGNRSNQDYLENIDEISQKSILLPVPALSQNTRPPAFIHTIELIITGTDTEAVRFVIKRDLSLKIKSFTLRYRFSSLPVYTPDSEHIFRSFVYDGDDVNTDASIKLNAEVKRTMTSSGCSAYISEVTLESGQVLTYEASEYKFVRRPKVQAVRTADLPRDNEFADTSITPPTTSSAPDTQPPMAEHQTPELSDDIKKKKRVRLTAILCVMCSVFVAEAIGGVCLYRYLGIKNSTDALMKEERYNEAYKIALDSDYESLLQRVCEKASAYYYQKGDLESAYVYAYGAPEKFTDTVIEYAAQSVVSMLTGDINKNAFRVAKMSENDQVFDVIVHSMLDILKSKGDFANAIRLSSEMRGDENRELAETSLFTDAIEYYAKNHKYSAAVTFLNELETISTFDKPKNECVAAAVEHFTRLGDSAGMIYLAHAFPEVTVELQSGMKVVPDDPGVRAEMAVVYPMLTAEQKRSFHSKTLAVWNGEVLEIENSKLSTRDKEFKNVISVDTSEDYTLILHTNGSVTLTTNTAYTSLYSIPTYSDVIAIAQGDAHSVLLHSDGKVTVHGSNSYGQANVSAWSNIVSVAAGQRFTLGLKSDGTVVAVGSNSAGQCDVSAYRNVVAVAACNQTSVLLFSDGTVKIEGYRSLGLSDIEKASEVTRIRAGGVSIAAELANGEYLCFSGSSGGDSGNPYNWRNIDAFDAGMMCIAGIDSDGVLYLDGDGIGG